MYWKHVLNANQAVTGCVDVTAYSTQESYKLQA